MLLFRNLKSICRKSRFKVKQLDISVVVPTFNRADFLDRTIKSILEQTYKAKEIIIIDDGSSDKTKKVVAKYDIKYIYQKNNGVSSARNRGMKEAKNKWIAFLDSDDEWEKQKLQKQVEFHKKNKDILCSHTGEKWVRKGKIVKYSSRLKKPKNKCFLDNLPTCKIAASSVLCHKKIFDKVGMFDESFKVCEDYDMWLRMTLFFQIGLINEPLIVKYAGHFQLSGEIFAIDRYHLKSLVKFLDTPYKNEVKKEIIRKINILRKGAIKHNNQEILKECDFIIKAHSFLKSL